jgi:hypothetical protein
MFKLAENRITLKKTKNSKLIETFNFNLFKKKPIKKVTPANINGKVKAELREKALTKGSENKNKITE